MITRVKVYNRFNMETVAKFGAESGFPFCGRRWHLVSIHGDSKRYLTPKVKEALGRIGMASCLSQEYWDITDDPKTLEALKDGGYKYVLFSKGMAKRIVGFLGARRSEPGDDVLVAHCDAGVSRSGAVATFACEFFGLDFKEFVKDNPYLSPNPMVLRMLRSEAGFGPMTAHEAARKAHVERKRKELDRLLDKYGHAFLV